MTASSSATYDVASALDALMASLKGKEGRAISEANHTKIATATQNIMKHTAIIKGVVDAAQRARDLSGYPLIASAPSIFDVKEEDDSLLAELRELNASLGTPTTRSYESRMDELDARIGVNLAMARLLAACE